jgi:hypothetical protein
VVVILRILCAWSLPVVESFDEYVNHSQLFTNMPSFSSALAAGALALLGVYTLALVVYRRFLHPLAKIPGPFLPAVSTLYQSAYNRKYYLQIEQMHKKYGKYSP